jgi:hypothetical protein
VLNTEHRRKKIQNGRKILLGVGKNHRRRVYGKPVGTLGTSRVDDDDTPI